MPQLDPEAHYILERADLDRKRGSEKNIHVNCVATYSNLTYKEALTLAAHLVDEDIFCDCRIVDASTNEEVDPYVGTYDFS